MKRVCVFAASNPGAHSEYEKAAKSLGTELVSKGLELVYGGSSVGLMGRVANATLDAGGKAIGVMPRGLFRGEIVHRGLTELHEVKDMHERKAMMSQLSDAFIALPGGFGTFEELFEAVTWAQIGIHKKPIGLLNVRGFYNPLVEMVRHAVKEGFVKDSNMELFVVESDPVVLLEKLAGYTPPSQEHKWSELPPV